MRRVRFMASAMSVASLALIAGAQSATAVPAGAGAAEAGSVRKAPFTKVQWDGGYGYGYGYGYGFGFGFDYDEAFGRWKHLPGWDSYAYDDAYQPSPCCDPQPYRPCCAPPPPPPQPCCAPRPYYAPAPYIPPAYTPLK